MSLLEDENFAARRAALAAEIAKQRGQLSSAYLDLEKPIRYTEYGMRGFGFIRQNPWVLTAAPAVVSLAVSLLGGRKKKKLAPVSVQTRSGAIAAEPPTMARNLSKVSQTLLTGAEQAMRAYNLYRRVRSFLP